MRKIKAADNFILINAEVEQSYSGGLTGLCKHLGWRNTGTVAGERKGPG